MSSALGWLDRFVPTCPSMSVSWVKLCHPRNLEHAIVAHLL